MNEEPMSRNATESSLLDVIRKINRTIATCPTETLLDFFEKHLETQFVPEFLNRDADQILSKLECMVKMGSIDAARILKDIGLRIARILAVSGVTSEDGGETTGSAPDNQMPEAVAGGQITVAGLLERLMPELAKLMERKPDELEAAWVGLYKRFGNDTYMLDEAVGIFMHGDLLAEGFHEGPDIIGNSIACKENRQKSEELVRKKKVIDMILYRMLVNRSRVLKNQAVLNTARQSYAWPAEISADASKRERNLKELLDNIELGKDLGLSITRKKRGPRSEIGTPVSLAETIFIDLEGERRSNMDLPLSHRALLEEEERKYDEGKLLSKDGEAIAWTPLNVWKLKAALLPNPSRDHIAPWVEAAMAWLEARVAHATRESLDTANNRRIKELELKRLGLQLNYPCRETREKNGHLAECNCEQCMDTLRQISGISNVLSERRNSQIEEWRRHIKFDFMTYALPERKDVGSKAKLRELIKNGFNSLFR